MLLDACRSKSPPLEVISKLIDTGGRELVIQTARDGNSALHFACRLDHPSIEVVSELIIILEVGS